jgi:hypothetical protein
MYYKERINNLCIKLAKKTFIITGTKNCFLLHSNHMLCLHCGWYWFEGWYCEGCCTLATAKLITSILKDHSPFSFSRRLSRVAVPEDVCML